MNDTEVTVDLEALRGDKQTNFQERLWFISYWVRKLKTLSDTEWTQMQADFINAQFKH